MRIQSGVTLAVSSHQCREPSDPPFNRTQLFVRAALSARAARNLADCYEDRPIPNSYQR